MSVFLDTKYLNYISNKLLCFKKVGDDLYNFRCPICGDSEKDELKARGYLYTFNEADNLVYKCHNCQISTTFRQLLKYVDQSLYEKYVLENMVESGKSPNKVTKTEQQQTLDNLKANKSITTTNTIVATNQTIFKDSSLIISINDLPNDHICKKYVLDRKIPTNKWKNLFYTPNYKKWINTIIKGKFKHDINDDPRLVIAYFDKDNHCFACQGRTLINSKVRYISVKFDEDKPMIFGLDDVKHNRTIYICEGPIDSMMIDNALAVSGSNYHDKLIESIKKYSVIIPDNEKRNNQVMKEVEKLIKDGFTVTLWPSNCHFKDINQAIIEGYTKQQLTEIINNNTVSGLSGLVKFKLWRNS